MSPKDPEVENPEHYNIHPMECIDIIENLLTEEEFRGYCLGNQIKYRWRRKYKGNEQQDLEKAEWYRNRVNRTPPEKPPPDKRGHVNIFTPQPWLEQADTD